MQRIIILFLCVILNSSAFATPVVSQVKGHKAVLFLDRLQAQPGDQFYTFDTNGNKIGLVEIIKIKDNKALAQILLGQAEPNFMSIVKADRDLILTTQDYKNLGLDDDYGSNEQFKPKAYDLLRSDRNSYGLMLSLVRGSMSVDVKDSFGQEDRVSLNGLGPGVYGFYDYMFLPGFGLRGAISYDQFRVNGSSNLNVCSGRTSQDCNTSADYLSGELTLKYHVMISRMRFWLGAGISYRSPVTASSSVLDKSTITEDTAYDMTLGADFALKTKHYIPISLQYQKPPSSQSASSALVILRIGYAFF